VLIYEALSGLGFVHVYNATHLPLNRRFDGSYHTINYPLYTINLPHTSTGLHPVLIYEALSGLGFVHVYNAPILPLNRRFAGSSSTINYPLYTINLPYTSSPLAPGPSYLFGRAGSFQSPSLPFVLPDGRCFALAADAATRRAAHAGIEIFMQPKLHFCKNVIVSTLEWLLTLACW
jgi:hypothetical protein